MNDFNILFLAVVLANFASFLWSVIGVFRQAEERKVGDYRSLQLVSVAIWIYSVYAVATTELPEAALIAGAAFQAVCLAVFWNQSRIVKKNGFSIAFSTDTPRVHVQHGLYRWVRHPFYSVYLTSYFTVALVTLSPVLGVLVVSMGYIYYRAARFEELKFKGSPLAESYASYQKRTGMFFPKLFAKVESGGAAENQKPGGGQAAA